MSSPTLVGRARVLADIHRALGAGVGVLLTGPPGMGRTCILRTLQGQLGTEAVRVTAGPATSPVPLAALARFIPGEVPSTLTAAALGAVRRTLGALAGAGTVLLLDEATSALDHENEQRIHQALLQLDGKLTIIIITHRETTIAHVRQRIVLGFDEATSA